MDFVETWQTAPATLLAIGTALNFVAMYFGFALLATWATERALPSLGIGSVVDARPRPRGQRRREIKLAMGAIVAFAAWTPVVVGLDRAGVIHVETNLDVGRVVRELVVLLLWNEVHFWVTHRLLHTPFLYRHVHAAHHRSTVPSPFSTYAMHPVEAVILGSIMLPVLFVMDLQLTTLMLYPVASLTLNTLGHANYTIEGLVSGCARAHAEHHKRARGLYGFVSSGLHTAK